MILLGIPHFVTKQSLFYTSNESKSVLPQENGGCRDSSGITKINQTDLSPELPEPLQYQKACSEKSMFFHLVPQYC